MNEIICITGNTATGTTTLTRQLSLVKGWKPVYSDEYIARSPYFGRFLHDPTRWAFHNQMFFIAEYFNAYRSAFQLPDCLLPICLDYSIFELSIYNEAMRRRGFLDRDEFDSAETLVDLLAREMNLPNLIIYLSASDVTLMQRIQCRGRKFEESIDREYLKELQVAFGQVFGRWKHTPLMSVDSEMVGFHTDEECVRDIADKALDMLL